MEVTLLYFDGCPNWRIADERLQTALERLGRSDVVVRRRIVSSTEQAEAWSFRGSPTVLVDGRDLFADPQSPVGLSCRVYPTDVGFEGSPTVEQLVEALDG